MERRAEASRPRTRWAPGFRIRSPIRRIAGGGAFAPLLLAAGALAQPPGPGPGDEERALGAVESLAAALADDPADAEATRQLRGLARGAAPTPALMEALVARADQLGPEGWLVTGVLLRRGLRPLDALEAFDRTPDRRAADLEAGRLFAELRSHDLALARFERHPDEPAAIYARAVVLARLRRHDEASGLVTALLAADRTHRAARLLRAELLDSTGRAEGAAAELRGLVAETGPDGPAGLRLARVLVQRGDGREALPILEAVLLRQPRNAEALLALGRAHRDAGRTAEAETAFRRALDGNPALNEARIALARLLARGGRREEAQPLFAEFERRAAVADESGRLLGAAELRPEAFGPAQAFVLHALRSGDFPLALRGAQRFLVEFPEQPERHLLLARVFVEGGRFPDARRVLERALDRFAGDGIATRRLEAALNALARRRRPEGGYSPVSSVGRVPRAASSWARTAAGAVPPVTARRAAEAR